MTPAGDDDVQTRLGELEPIQFGAGVDHALVCAPEVGHYGACDVGPCRHVPGSGRRAWPSRSGHRPPIGPRPFGRDDVYGRRLGMRLRDVRHRRGWSLIQVSRMSGGLFSASSVASYETAERTISVWRLEVLADIYRISAADLLPGRVTSVPCVDAWSAAIVLDVDAVRAGHAGECVRRWCEGILAERARSGDATLQVRHEDFLALAAILGVDVEDLPRHLGAIGVLVPPPSTDSAGGALRQPTGRTDVSGRVWAQPGWLRRGGRV